jgi:hypothetical protein
LRVEHGFSFSVVCSEWLQIMLLVCFVRHA